MSIYHQCLCYGKLAVTMAGLQMDVFLHAQFYRTIISRLWLACPRKIEDRFASCACLKMYNTQYPYENKGSVMLAIP